VRLKCCYQAPSHSTNNRRFNRRVFMLYT
jgi:hypothetical protein